MSSRFRYTAAIALLCGCILSALPTVSAQEESWPTPPEAVEQPGVPRGKVAGPFEFRSKIFPGTVRQYWVYIPAQYDAAKPPCLMVVQDGLGMANAWKLPTVLDNLIHAGRIPVQLGLFVNHGLVPAPSENAQPRFNRSFEYDGLGDRYARFLIEEMLPEIRKTWVFSDDPNDRCIAGASSGAIAAFNAAWERPDAFRRVFSTIGTYVALRGGDQFPGLVRKTENKPLRIFLQDGSRDLDIYAGSWWHANQAMLSALQYAGYDVKHIWGDGAHNGRQGAAIAPEALAWLWRDYPQPIKPGRARERRVDLLIDGEDWQLVSRGHGFTEGPAVNSNGELFFTDIPNNRIHKVDAAGSVSTFAENTGNANGLAFGPDNHLYACRAADSQIVRYNPDGSFTVFAAGVKGNDLVILADGSGYVTEPTAKKIWHFNNAGKLTEVDSGIEFPNGLMVSPDHTLLNVSDTRGRFCWSFSVPAPGRLEAKQEYGWLHVTDHGRSDADGMAVDTEGRVYVTTALGVQVLDQPGRVNFIISKPAPQWLSNVTFGGKDGDLLYVTCGDSVWKRRIRAKGIQPALGPVTPPKPGL